MGYINLAVSAIWFLMGGLYMAGIHKPTKLTTTVAYITTGFFMLGLGLKQLGVTE